MPLAVVYSRANVGIYAPLVEVEVHISNGFPGLAMVGLPEAAVKESKDRVRSAIINSRFEFPIKKITVNLAPADLPKEGGRYDLAIALGILAASGQIPQQDLLQYEVGGELGLSGELRDFHGALPMVLAAQAAHRRIILPRDTAQACAVVSQNDIFGANHLTAVCAHLSQQTLLPYVEKVDPETVVSSLDLADVKGQYRAKRALEIAASGGHSLVMVGPPGAGKTMLANRLVSILPPLERQQAQEVASIYSLYHDNHQGMLYKNQRPFRNPHHTASSAALVGGGRKPKPGEVSLAHHGVLFLDELPEFSRASLEALREPLESGVVSIARAAYSVSYPARFQLIAAMNPCPCGYAGENTAHGQSRCRCSPEQMNRYQKKISGPLLDRIDLHVTLSPVSTGLLLEPSTHHAEKSGVISARVKDARARQWNRHGCLNADLNPAAVNEYCHLPEADQHYLHTFTEKFGLSARSIHRVLRLARTIADLSESNSIQTDHLQEALLYRPGVTNYQ